ncbi:MAG: Nif3-like dinuclear metal center hexameric protein [Bacteroidales bacterium]|nr:Nif3-like dinuclear metal center hexameric protein [Bacteroidales bacterium]
MFASMDVLRKAVALDCNLIIAHEPLYYNHSDATALFSDDPVFLEKQKYIRDNNLVIWRFHDYIHRMQPDGIQAGMASKLGWEKYLAKGSTSSFLVPETNLGAVLVHLKKIFPGSVFNVIGKKDMKVRTIKIAVGAPGSQAHFRLLREQDTDLLLAGEVPQWETYEYMRDAVAQGRNKAIVFLGHVQSEEAGMDYCAAWLKGFIKDIPVHFVETGASYWQY